MSLVHVYPLGKTQKAHIVKSGSDCWCEPEVIDCGKDNARNPARVFVHSARKKIGWYDDDKKVFGF